MIVAEGYTDVIAMHQAGLRNTVGLMGTALTEEQVGELARLAPRVQLALDADGAGQEAMLRAARVAAGRRLELRVVPLPAGHGPGRPRRGRGRAGDAASSSTRRSRSCASAWSASSRPATSGPRRARTRSSARCAPCSRQIPPSALREELIALVADRTDLSPALVGSWLAQGTARARHGGGGRGERGGGSRDDRGASPGAAARLRDGRRWRPSRSFSRCARGADGGGGRARLPGPRGHVHGRRDEACRAASPGPPRAARVSDAEEDGSSPR